MRGSDHAAGFYLVLFEKQPEGLVPADGQGAATEIRTNRAIDDEVDYLKQQLSATVEQYEAANEELRSSYLVLASQWRELARETTAEANRVTVILDDPELASLLRGFMP